MSQDVNIIGVDGAPQEDWATEATLRMVLATIKKCCAAGKASDDQQMRLLRQFNDGGDDALFAARQLNKDMKAADKKDDEVRKLAKQSYAKSLSDTMGGSKNGPSEQLLSKLHPSLGLVGTALDTLWAAMREGQHAYDIVYKAGLSSTNAMFDAFTQGAATLGIMPKEFAESIKGYTQVLNYEGLMPFTNQLKTIRNTMKDFGMSYAEATVYHGEWMEQQRGMNNIDFATSAKGRAAELASVDVTRQFAKVLGMSTEDLIKQRTTNANEIDAKLALLNVHKNSKEAFNAISTDAKKFGSSLGTAITEVAQGSRESAVASKAYQSSIRGFNNADVANMFIDLANSARDGGLTMDNYQAKFKEYLELVVKVGDEQTDQLQIRMRVGDEDAKLAMAEVVQAKTTLASMKATQTDQGAAALRMNQALKQIGDSISTTATNILSNFFDPVTMGYISAGLDFLSETLQKYTVAAQKWLKGLDKTEMKDMLSDGIDSAVTFMKGLPDMITGIIAAIKNTMGNMDYMMWAATKKLSNPNADISQSQYVMEKQVDEQVAKIREHGGKVSEDKISAAKEEGRWLLPKGAEIAGGVKVRGDLTSQLQMIDKENATKAAAKAAADKAALDAKKQSVIDNNITGALASKDGKVKIDETQTPQYQQMEFQNTLLYQQGFRIDKLIAAVELLSHS